MCADLTAAVDLDGFLLDYRQWSLEAAKQLATVEEIDLTAEHLQVLETARAFYQKYQRSPDMRPLVRWVREQLGEDYGNSIALMQLFPGQTARLVSKLAGLPKPPNCL
ncbi:MAG: TusE/DsrC/DsvC family sulfur relay protein [Pseudomonadales bacterium]